MLGAALAILVAASSPDDFCATLGKTAEGIMAARQQGVIMSEMLGVVEPGQFEDLFKSLIIEAYQSPRFSGDDMQKRTIREFRNRAELTCYRQAKGSL